MIKITMSAHEKKLIPDEYLDTFRGLLDYMLVPSHIGQVLVQNPDMLHEILQSLEAACLSAPSRRQWRKDLIPRVKSCRSRFEQMRLFLVNPDTWLKAGFSQRDLSHIKEPFTDAEDDMNARINKCEADKVLRRKQIYQPRTRKDRARQFPK